MRLMKKARTDSIRTLLRDFDVDDRTSNKQGLAEILSEQLYYETDDE